MPDFTGKLILVTGGAKGVGRVIAREFARCGARVLVNYFHSREAAREAQAELERMGAFAGLLCGSVARRDHVSRMFEQIRRDHGHLDVLVNNAASGALLPLAELTDRDWARAVDTNLKGSLWCAQDAVPLMRPSGGGAIVNLSSMGASHVLDNYLTLGTTKAAVEALTRYLAAEYAHQGIRVNAASCSNIDGTAMDLFPNAGEMAHMIMAASPLGRMPSEREYASLVLFLASEEASWITGQTVLADGGLSLGYGATSTTSLRARGRPPWLTLAPTAPLPDAVRKDRSARTRRPAPDSSPVEQVAVVGMGLVVPGADSPEAFWSLLRAGAPRFSEPGMRFDIDRFFDPDPSAIDRTHVREWGHVHGHAPQPGAGDEDDFAARWLRHALRHALDGVRLSPDDRCAFLLGCNASTQHLEESVVAAACERRLASPSERPGATIPGEGLRSHLRYAGEGPHRYMPHVLASDTAGAALPGAVDVVTVDTACSSALYALDLGIRRLQAGRCDVAVCAGVHVLNPMDMVLFSKTGAVAADGQVRVFGQDAGGTLFSDGAAAVVLKPLERAKADGDTILGVVAGVGLSNNGRGKALFAPNQRGQRLAIERALDASGIRPGQVGLIVAHATGTPVGDTTELAALQSVYTDNARCPVVSNKSLVGHTGWAAGLTSLIHAILALRNDIIPRQRLSGVDIAPQQGGDGALLIPREDRPWRPEPGLARTAAVSAFGFGGTNAHVILQEDQATTAPPIQRSRPQRQPGDDPIVVVGWSTDLPGAPASEEVAQWLLGTADGPPAGFGDHPQPPPITQLTLPPAKVRQWDRTHVMALRATHALQPRLGDLWRRIADKVGVIAAHCGPTRNTVLHSVRVRLGDLERVVLADQLDGTPPPHEQFQEFTEAVRSLIPPACADSEVGKMANVISGRVANHFDFRGPTLTIDTGIGSTFQAIDIASDYLRSGDLDLALVVGLNGNSLPEMTTAASQLTGCPEAVLAEGAIMFALTRGDIAERERLPILATLGGESDEQAPCMAMKELIPADRTYLAGDSAIALLRAIISGMSCTIEHHEALAGAHSRCVVAAGPQMGHSGEHAQSEPTQVLPGEGSPKPDTEHPLERHAVVWEAATPDTSAHALPAIPDHCVIVTMSADTLADTDLPQHVLIIAARAGTAASPATLAHPSADQATDYLAQRDWRPEHLRVIVPAGARREPDAPGFEELLDTHELMFLAAKQVGADLQSMAVLILDAFDQGVPWASTGLFTGFVKALARERPNAVAYTVLTSQNDVRTALAQLAAESRCRRGLPVAGYDHGRRLVPVVARCGPSSAGDPAVATSSVVLATGGARGVTAELLAALAREHQPRIWILGSNDLDSYPTWVFDSPAGQPPDERAEYLRRRLEDPTVRVADASREYDRILHARAARGNLDRLTHLCGPGNVHYLVCDITNAAAVDSAVQTVLSHDGRVDLVLHGAGISRTADLDHKTPADFRSVRDVKVLGYAHLRRALASQTAVRWVNMGSVAGLTGLPGEVDYCSGNDFLASAAFHAHHRGGSAQTTIGWTLWDSVGFAATPLTRAFMARNGFLTAMSTTQGTELFLHELSDQRVEPIVVHLGTTEWHALRRWHPDLHPRDARTTTPHRAWQPHFHDRRSRPAPQQLVWERLLNLRRDPYLADHLVDGRPTMPGAFTIEMAAEIATELVPGCTPVAFESLRFHRWLRPHPRRRETACRLTAQLLENIGPLHRVQVRVTSDLIAPDGTSIRRDLPHFDTTVVLADEIPPTPQWHRWHQLPGTPVPSPYDTNSGGTVQFRGAFRGLSDIRCGANGLSALHACTIPTDDPAFAHFTTPAVLTDAMIQLCGHGIDTVQAVRAVGRIDLYRPANDLELAAVHPDGIRLRCRVSGPDADPALTTASVRCCAVDADDRMILEIRSVEFNILALRQTTLATGDPITQTTSNGQPHEHRAHRGLAAAKPSEQSDGQENRLP